MVGQPLLWCSIVATFIILYETDDWGSEGEPDLSPKEAIRARIKNEWTGEAPQAAKRCARRSLASSDEPCAAVP